MDMTHIYNYVYNLKHMKCVRQAVRMTGNRHAYLIR